MTTTSPPPSGVAHTVLVVTANEATRVFITDGLRRDTYTVYAAATVADAQLMLAHGQPDAAIIDTDLPAVRALLRNLLAPDVALLLLTDVDDMPHDDLPGRAVTCLPKPFQWFALRLQLTLLLLDSADDAARGRLPRHRRARDGEQLVVIDRLGDHTVLLAYDDRGAGAHWAPAATLHEQHGDRVAQAAA
jgi:DNA-binding response OmpR family regulator